MRPTGQTADKAPSGPATASGDTGRWFVLPALVALVLLAYWPGRGGGFVFDDFPNLVENLPLHVSSLDWHAWLAATFSSPASGMQRPLAMLTFAVNHYFTGLDPAPMKLTNIAIHALNALLVLGLVRQLLALLPGVADPRRRLWAARFAAAAWALHPINLMAVLYVVQRMESLSHTFVFAGLWLYLAGRQRQLDGGNGWGWIGAGLVLGTGLGVLAKESAVLLPLYAFCAELCLLGFRRDAGRPDRRLQALYAGVLFVPAVVGLAWLWPRVAGAYAIRDFTLAERLLTEPRVVLDYLRWIVLPDLGQLSLYHDDYPVSRGLLQPPATALALLGIAALLGLAGWCRARRPLVALGLLWFLGAQLLTATLIPLELVYEHRNYFASLGIVLVLADVLLLAPRREGPRRIGALLALVALLAFATTTHLRAREWSDPYRFASSEAAKHPDSPRAAYGLAQLLVVMTAYDPDSALVEPARQALEHAGRLPDSGILPHAGLLLLAANTGAATDPVVWRELQARLRAGPVGPQEIGALGSLARCARDGGCRFPAPMMLASFEAALRHGHHPDVLTIYGDYVLNVLHDPRLAMRLWREARALAPRNAQYRINLIKMLIATGRTREAQQEIDALRVLGRFGQHAAAADHMQARLAQ